MATEIASFSNLYAAVSYPLYHESHVKWRLGTVIWHMLSRLLLPQKNAHCVYLASVTSVLKEWNYTLVTSFCFVDPLEVEIPRVAVEGFCVERISQERKSQ